MKVRRTSAATLPLLALATVALTACAGNNTNSLNQLPTNSRLNDRNNTPNGNNPNEPAISPALATDKVKSTPSSPGFWLNPTDAAKSLILGLDLKKDKSSLVAFDLQGKLKHTVEDLGNPTSLASKENLVVIALPGKLKVFAIDPETQTLKEATGKADLLPEASTNERNPSAITLSSHEKEKFVTVAFQRAPKESNLAQYRLNLNEGKYDLKLVRRFGQAPAADQQPTHLATDESNNIVATFPKGTLATYPSDPTKEGSKPLPTTLSAAPASHILPLFASESSATLLGLRTLKNETSAVILDSSVSNTSPQPKPLILKLSSAGATVVNQPVTERFANGLLILADANQKNFQVFDLGTFFAQLGVTPKPAEPKKEANPKSS